MSKAIVGLAELGGAIAMGAAAFFDPELLASPFYDKLMFSLALGGIASEAGALADALAANRGMFLTTRQPAGNCQIIYGEVRVGGALVYASTTGKHKDQYNKMIVVCAHPVDAFVNLYLDGRQVLWTGDAGSRTSASGVTFGGDADSNDHYDAGNNKYNFGGLVFAEAHYGTDPVGYYDPAFNANDPTWAPDANGSPYGGDVSNFYCKVEYDATMFPGEPEIKITVRGKSNIYDPRTGTRGYTANWALVVADVLMDTEYGLRVPQSFINMEQLIAAANLCDEAVPLANGSTEPRYTFNRAFDTSSSPGDIIQTLMTSAGGMLTYSGGQFYIWPAAAYSSSFSFTEDDLIDGIQGSAYRGMRDTYNRVQGIFTCPNYPYTPFGDLYNANGHDPDGYSQNNFNLAWQQTSYPPYAQDPLHGYATDAWLNLDGGVENWMTLNMPGVISLATAQRLAKIALLRNRLQKGAYSFKFKLNALKMFPQDVFTLSFPQFGWSEKSFQVSSFQLALEYTDDGAPRMYCAVNATDYDPNTCSWDSAGGDELTILDAPAFPLQGRYEVAAPTEITCTSGAGTDVVNADGTLTPRVEVSWSDPQDVLVTLIEVQWSVTAMNRWTSIGTTPVGLGYAYIVGATAGEVIDVRVRSLRGDGAASTWDEITGYTVSDTSVSTMTAIGLAPGVPWNYTNNAVIQSYPQSAEYSRVVIGSANPPYNYYPVTFYTGAGAYTVPSYAIDWPPSTPGIVIYKFNPGYRFRPGNLGSGLANPGFYIVSDWTQVQDDQYMVVGSFTSCAFDGTGGVNGGGTSSGGGPNGPRSMGGGVFAT